MAASSLSGPEGYIQARNEAKITDNNNNDESPSSTSIANANVDTIHRYFLRTVERRPYYPFLRVDPREKATIIEVARVIASTWRNDGGNERANDGREKMSAVDSENSSAGEVTVITGGLTNALFKVDLPPNNADDDDDDNATDDDDGNSVLVRIFGAEGMIDRDVETSTFARLCDRNSTGAVHAKLDLMGRFRNGRVETWIPNMRQAHYKFDFERRGLGMEVARQLARLHYGFSMDGDAEVEEEVEGGASNDRKERREPALWKVAESWIEELSQLLSHERFHGEEESASEDASWMELFSGASIGEASLGEPPSDTAAKIKESLSNQLAWLKDRVETHHPNAPIVFCHNDVNAANILLHSSIGNINNNNTNNNTSDDDDENSFHKESVAIIDYEYGSLNYAMYDVANFECEHCGGNDNGVPNSELLPGADRQRAFLEEYVQQRNEISKNGEGEYAGRANAATTTPSEEVRELRSQVRLFRMASDLYWGIWGILQAAGEVVADGSFGREGALSRLEGEVDLDKWDNLRYGKNRLERYRVCKEGI